MGTRRTAAIALDLVLVLASRLAAAGVRPEQSPTPDENIDLVWCRAQWPPRT